MGLARKKKTGKEMKKKRENAWKEGRTVPLPPRKEGRGERTAGGTSGQDLALVKLISHYGASVNVKLLKL